MSLQPVLVTLSKNELGGFDYSVPASTMLSEALKLAISAVLLIRGMLSGQITAIFHDDSVSEFFSYAVPAGIYFINNNCIFYILQAVDPTTFQLLSQMKTIFTGLLFRVFLKRRLTAVQYLALITLACGTAISQVPSCERHTRGAQAAAPLLGALLSVLSSLLSALGGIYNEKLLKGRPTTSIHWQNIQMCVASQPVRRPCPPTTARVTAALFPSPASTSAADPAPCGTDHIPLRAVLRFAPSASQLHAIRHRSPCHPHCSLLTAPPPFLHLPRYIWGVAFNAVGAYMKDGQRMSAVGLTAGFGVAAVSVVVCNALNGLAISAVLKYADNIARVYAHAIAMMITMGVSIALFNAKVTPQLVLAALLVATSTWQYNLPKAWLQVAEDEEGVHERSALISAVESSEEESTRSTMPGHATKATVSA